MSILFDAIQRHAIEKPECIALQGGGKNISYGALSDEINKKCEILARRGVKVLGLRMPNSVDWILWDLAAAMSGAICVPLPLFFTDEQVSYIIEKAGINACVTDRGLIKTDAKPCETVPNRTSKVTFTSGTTGAPKGVCLPMAGLERVAISLVEAIGQQHAARHLSVMPLSILLENVAGVYATLMAGATVFIPDPKEIGMENPFQPDFEMLANFINEQKITLLIVASELLRGLIYVATKNPSLFSSLSFIAVGGSKISPSLIIAARFLGLPVYEGYGLSECGSVVSLNTPSHDYPDSVGKTLPHIKAKIDDGEIIVENPIYLGYLGDNPLKADAALSTGDLGEISATGALKISGRKKNIIITSHARNISPEWIESHFLAQPEIAQVVVYGDGLPYPQALIVPLRGKADIAGAVGRANRSLPIYAQVKTFSVVPTFTPQNGMLTTTGRLRRAQILSFYKSIIEKESENDVLRQTG